MEWIAGRFAHAIDGDATVVTGRLSLHRSDDERLVRIEHRLLLTGTDTVLDYFALLSIKQDRRSRSSRTRFVWSPLKTKETDTQKEGNVDCFLADGVVVDNNRR